jgi:hypothetical protein
MRLGTYRKINKSGPANLCPTMLVCDSQSSPLSSTSAAAAKNRAWAARCSAVVGVTDRFNPVPPVALLVCDSQSSPLSSTSAAAAKNRAWAARRSAVVGVTDRFNPAPPVALLTCAPTAAGHRRRTNHNARRRPLESLIGVRIHAGEPDILLRTLSAHYLTPNSRWTRISRRVWPCWRRSCCLRCWALRNPSRQTAGLPALTAERLRSALLTPR